MRYRPTIEAVCNGLVQSASSDDAVCVGGVGGSDDTGDLLPNVAKVVAGPFVAPFDWVTGFEIADESANGGADC